VDRPRRRRTPAHVSAVPLVGDDVFVVLSAPDQGLFSWARLNPISRLLPPLLAFFLALGAVIYAADRTVVRWIGYLQRIAAIYARGRFTVRPVQAERAPPEIRDLAATLDEMASAIVAKDTSLHESLAHKDGLMREIHHRVKNNLQVISSLLSMQQRALTDPAARQAITDTRQRITALALIYRALYQGADLKRVDLRPFLEELTAQVLASDSAHAIRTEVHADPLVIDPDSWRRWPCSRSRRSATPRSTPSPNAAAPCGSTSTCAAKRPNCRSATTGRWPSRPAAAAWAAP
jgi:signal transduction histidine kinase